MLPFATKRAETSWAWQMRGNLMSMANARESHGANIYAEISWSYLWLFCAVGRHSQRRLTVGVGCNRVHSLVEPVPQPVHFHCQLFPCNHLNLLVVEGGCMSKKVCATLERGAKSGHFWTLRQWRKMKDFRRHAHLFRPIHTAWKCRILASAHSGLALSTYHLPYPIFLADYSHTYHIGRSVYHVA